MPRVLAIDYGLQRTGLAWTDPLGLIATPLPAVLTAQLLPWLQKHVGPETIETVVVGHPLRLDGRATHATAPTEAFYESLGSHFPQVQRVWWDERLSSRAAHQALALGGATRTQKRDKMLVNSVAAAIILQGYLEWLAQR